MTKTLRLLGASTLALALAGGSAAFAQTTLTGTQALNDRIDDVDQAVADDLARSEDTARFGNPEFRPGLSGSASLGYSGKTGNNDSQELSVGARLRYASGAFVQTIGVALDYAESAGASTKEDVFAVYDANYYFNDQFYAFVLGRVETDGLASTAGQVKTDAFVGVGPGWRVINNPDLTWRVQAGVGVSYLEDGTGDSDTEAAAIASSRLFYGISPTVFLTNDTDILKSDSALRINNDIGVNYKMTDTLSTRVSYLTEYNDSRAIRSDNKLGVSLVMGF
jgi:putative salt-induced outer membrane protein